MPYNNTPIQPPKEVTGTVSLPLARVKKIINQDDDISGCSNNAAFVITIATEMFVQYLVERTHDVIKAEKRPRRNVQYNDVATAVARRDNLEFLSDVVPRTTTFGQVQARRARKEKAARAQAQAVEEEEAHANGHGHAEEEGAEEMEIDQQRPLHVSPNRPRTAGSVFDPVSEGERVE
ncbi:hypothetical protein EJ06DRAFT_552535 [Trichodelitschia bisporula]|uniref:Transcription factor CBF/NF-Y/archaeal histone domain-containing protein n=1 Tax=Trichodelitschia bisporula TaxID=703511 RepID=A0A6G1I9V7_9PEZI|nr:hypothetical protein EJ06DRAFT_552535 [Trichodelitschia bisporula]